MSEYPNYKSEHEVPMSGPSSPPPPSTKLIYVVREFLNYASRVQRIDSRVVKNYATEMHKALLEGQLDVE